MKKNIVIIVLALLLAVSSIAYFASLNIYQDQMRQLTATQPPSKTTTDVVMFCQEIASKATNKDWGYKSCLDEVSKTIKKRPVETL